MTTANIWPQNCFEADVAPTGPHRGRSHCLAELAEPRSAAFDSPPRVPTPIITVSRIAAVEYLSLMPRQGDEPLRRVTDSQARSLLALSLVDPICKSRRGVIVGLRVRLGVSVAAINAALRQGAGNRLPIAEDNRTVRRMTPKSAWEPHHVDEWDDGRRLDGRCMDGMTDQPSKIDRGNDD